MRAGYKCVTPVQLANIVQALREGRIHHHAFRVWFACLEMIAIREAARRVRRKKGETTARFDRYRVEEIEELTGLEMRSVRRALRVLMAAGLMHFGEREIVVTKEGLPGSELLREELACRRSPKRPIPVPRPMLRFLARNPTQALSLVVLGYLCRGLSIARTTAEINPSGTIKASWIAGVFGLSLRSVRYAQATLVSLGWIGRDQNSHQLKLNRHGAYFTINLEWGTAPERTLVNSHNCGKRIAPPAPENAPRFAPPKKDLKTSYEDQDQKARATEPAGVCFSKGKNPELPPPDLRHVLKEDLHRFDRMEILHRQAVQRGWINSSEAMALNFLGAAIRAREVGRNPGGMFSAIIREGLWSHITQAQEDTAARALRRFRESEPQRFRPLKTPAPPDSYFDLRPSARSSLSSSRSPSMGSHFAATA